MNNGYFKSVLLKDHIAELPKSFLPASAANDMGYYDFFCSSAEKKTTDVCLQNAPAVIMGTGGVASVHLGQSGYSYSTDTWGIRSRTCELDTEYLYYLLQLRLEEIDYFAFEGSGLRHLRKDYIRNMLIDLPKKEVALRIVQILKCIDGLIDNVRLLIDKYNKIKTGLMYDLLTRGIDSDGKLRPKYESNPDLYKKTSLGNLPKDWSVIKLGDLLAPVYSNFRSGPFGSALLKSELVEEGIPFLGIDNIKTEKFDNNYKRFVSEKKFNELRKYFVRERDVIITIMGTVGRAAVVPQNIGKALSSKHLWTMTFDESYIIPELVCWQLNYAPWVKSWFRKETQGGIMDAIQSKTLKSLLLPVPGKEEQKNIFERYSMITKKIHLEEYNLQKLLEQKKGLMHDLLTGKIFVLSKLETREITHV
ncbi:restriction endonuclease subunit S [Leclercia adecarboxylata]|uniref:restriction endonuclease subunit S n=1 Tax=Leclercia adecarboxylata TaxID=83655 RepID=UPI0013C6A9A8|nr:restriction endonuclease subunit S [Leclercia adecarboxylata]NEG94524.1 restriction endonuclease subunit S [Leclercia adecarboxylata]